jgi:hypothetical protein
VKENVLQAHLLKSDLLQCQKRPINSSHILKRDLLGECATQAHILSKVPLQDSCIQTLLCVKRDLLQCQKRFSSRDPVLVRKLVELNTDFAEFGPMACQKRKRATGMSKKKYVPLARRKSIVLLIFSKTLYIGAAYSEYTRALTFPNLCDSGFWRVTVSHILKSDLLQCQKRPINSSHIQWLLARYGVTGLDQHAVSCHDLFAAYKKARVN